MRWEVNLDVQAAVTHTSGASTTREAVAYVASEAGTVPLSRTLLLAASKFTAAAIILDKHNPQTLATAHSFKTSSYY